MPTQVLVVRKPGDKCCNPLQGGARTKLREKPARKEAKEQRANGAALSDAALKRKGIIVGA